MYEPQSGSAVVILMNRFGVGEHVPTAVFREFARELNPILGIPVPDTEADQGRMRERRPPGTNY